MKKRGRTPEGSTGGEQGFWPSYADMMSAVALILFFMMLLAYVQNLITNHDLQGKEQELADTLAQLEITSQQLDKEKLELDVTSAKLEAARVDLDEQQIHIDEQQSYIDQQQSYIDAQQSQIDDQKSRIESQEALLSQQQANIDAQLLTIAEQQALAERQQQYLNSTQAELSQLRTQMQAVAGLRVSIVEQIITSIQNVMGSTNSVSVSDNGSLVLSESVLFDQGNADLKDASRQVLDQLASGFAAFLSDADNMKYVDTIVIGGHADSTGSAKLNWDLSTRRANSVLDYLLSAQNGALDRYADFFSASGYGATRPVADNSTPEGRAQNRRIEISIVLKDESVMEILDQYLAIEVPTTEG